MLYFGDEIMSASKEDMKQNFIKAEEAFGKYSEKVFAFALTLTGDAEEARDITAEAFVKLLSEPAAADPDFMVKSWLFKVAANLSKNFMMRFVRKIMRLPNYLMDAFNSSVSDVHADALRKEEFDLLDRAMKSLDAADRQIIYLRFYEEMSYSEIAGIIEAPEGTVASRLSRALRRLSDEFESR